VLPLLKFQPSCSHSIVTAFGGCGDAQTHGHRYTQAAS
jgi:hypothetical protein